MNQSPRASALDLRCLATEELLAALFVTRERTARVVLRIKMSARLPKFREESLLKRGAQIADAFRAAGAAFAAHHPLDHLDVVRAPQRKELVVFQERFG